jgi:hypothetical protein
MNEGIQVVDREPVMPENPGQHWYPPGPISREFVLDESFIVGLRGPFGSGKSVSTVIKLLRNVKKQMAHRGPDGWARRRTAIIRNTYPELRTTTMNTFFAWVPKHLGHWRDAGPPTLHIVDKDKKLDWEILFVALDRPDDLKKLLGIELSDVWINEAREVPKAILDGLTGRVGRYPAIWQGGCACAQIIMDTNPPDTEHWWYILAENDMSNEKNRSIIQSILEAQEILRERGFLGKDQKMFSFYAQPSGRSPHAENLRNLRAGYYEFQMAGKDPEWIKVYVDGDYGFIMDGLAVFPEYKDNFHAGEDFPILRGIGFRLGFDFGLTPAATLSQRGGNGRWFVHDEFTTERMGIVTFAEELKRKLAEKYPGIKITSARGDPAGDAVTPEENTCFKILHTAGFTIAEKAPTQDPTRRREGVAFLLRNVIDGKPAISINPRALVLRKGMSGGYHRRRLQVAGENRYREVPEKNIYSHVCEALEYDVVSAGEDRNVTVSQESREGKRAQSAETDYDMFNT